MNILGIKVFYLLIINYYFSSKEDILYLKVLDILVKFFISPYSGLNE